MASLEIVTGLAEAVDPPLYFDSAEVNGWKSVIDISERGARTNFLTGWIKALHR